MSLKNRRLAKRINHQSLINSQFSIFHPDLLPGWLSGLFRQYAGPEGLAALDRVAMHTQFGDTALWTLEHTRISSVAGGFTIPPRMDSHADDRTPWEAFQRNPLFKCFPGTFHLNHPYQRLAFLVAHQSVPFFVQRNEVKLKVGGVGDHANDHSGKDPVHTSVIHGIRMMSIRRRRQKPHRQDHDEYRKHPRRRRYDFHDMHCQSSVFPGSTSPAVIDRPYSYT